MLAACIVPSRYLFVPPPLDTFKTGMRPSSPLSLDGSEAELLWIAEYERRGLDAAAKLLGEELGQGSLISAFRVFVDAIVCMARYHAC